MLATHMNISHVSVYFYLGKNTFSIFTFAWIENMCRSIKSLCFSCAGSACALFKLEV